MIADSISKVSGVLDCRHIFCYQCIESWTKMSNSCPLCKKPYLQIIKSKNGKSVEVIVIEEPYYIEEGEEPPHDDVIDNSMI